MARANLAKNTIKPDSAGLGVTILDLAQETDLLRQIPMFAKLDTSKLKLLAFTSEMVNYRDQDILFYMGDSADCAYVIMSGEVDIVLKTETGYQTLSTLSENQLFGEMAILSNAPRVATLRARGDLSVMKITADMFLNLLTENSEMALDVMRQLSAKLAKSHAQVEALKNQSHTAE